MATNHVEGWASQFSQSAGGSSGPKYVTPAAEYVTIEGLVKMARTSSSQMTAMTTLTTSITYGPLVWANSRKRASQIENTFFYRQAPKIIENIMVLGFVVWRLKRGIIEVAEPGDFLIRYTGTRWVPVHSKRTVDMRGSKDWHVTIFDEPAIRAILPGSLFGKRSSIIAGAAATITGQDIRSACARSYNDALRQQALERNYVSRDRFNAMPTVFTSVSGDVGNSAGNFRTWFRDVNIGAAGRLAGASGAAPAVAGGNFPPQRSSDFSQLVRNRADTLQRLSESTADERRRAEAAHDNMIEDGMNIQSTHREFVLTDGKTMNDSKTLLSCSDASFQYNRARHSVMALMGVPAQAIGESVNTERNSANSRQFETAMLVYASTVRRVRNVINEILAIYGRTGTDWPESTSHLSPHAIETLAPMLKSEKLLLGVAEVYDIDPRLLDIERIRKYQDTLLTDKTDAAPAATADPDKRASQIKRKEANREKVSSKDEAT